MIQRADEWTKFIKPNNPMAVNQLKLHTKELNEMAAEEDHLNWKLEDGWFIFVFV